MFPRINAKRIDKQWWCDRAIPNFGDTLIKKITLINRNRSITEFCSVPPRSLLAMSSQSRPFMPLTCICFYFFFVFLDTIFTFASQFHPQNERETTAEKICSLQKETLCGVRQCNARTQSKIPPQCTHMRIDWNAKQMKCS